MELPALMYVSEVTLGPRMITPVTEATNARKSVAFSDFIASKTGALALVRACLPLLLSNVLWEPSRGPKLRKRPPSVVRHHETRSASPKEDTVV